MSIAASRTRAGVVHASRHGDLGVTVEDLCMLRWRLSEYRTAGYRAPRSPVAHVMPEPRQSRRYIVTTQAPPRPRLCWRATLAPGTCRFSALPRSCQLSSEHCASPVAPSGCPFEMRPPEGLTTHRPP